VEATCKDGVLTVQVPKSPEVTAHKIAVKSSK
jgi:HSP20 family molecular chaperone IbpA